MLAVGDGRRRPSARKLTRSPAPTAARSPIWRRSTPWPGTTAAECRAGLGKSGEFPCRGAGEWFKGQSPLSPWTAFYSVYFLSESAGNSDWAILDPTVLESVTKQLREKSKRRDFA